MRTMTDEEFRALLLTSLDVPRWADEVMASGPFAAVSDLVFVATEVARRLSPEEVEQALAAHPRIGERPSGDGIAEELSRAEQSAEDADDEKLAAELIAGNEAYEERFDRVFLIRATGRSRQDIVNELHRRMVNDDESELAEVRQQLAEIAVLRIEKLFGDEMEETTMAEGRTENSVPLEEGTEPSGDAEWLTQDGIEDGLPVAPGAEGDSSTEDSGTPDDAAGQMATDADPIEDPFGAQAEAEAVEMAAAQAVAFAVAAAVADMDAFAAEDDDGSPWAATGIAVETEPEIKPEPALPAHAEPEPAALYVNSRLSTHVINATSGRPAAGMGVALLGQSADNAGSWIPLAVNVTDAAGRIGQLSDGPLQPGTYRLLYDTGAYWQLQDADSFYPEIVITFTVAEDSHLHLPLSLSPFAFSTYRGS